MKKRITSTILALLLLLALLPAGALADGASAQPSTDAEYVAEAKKSVTWDSIKGTNKAQDSVTDSMYSLTSAITVSGKSVAVSWSTDCTTGALSVANYYGWKAYVDRPAGADVSATLTAELSYDSDKSDSVPAATDTVAFPLTIKAEGVTTPQTVASYGTLLQGISETGAYTSSSDAWIILEMEKYTSKDVSDADYNAALGNAKEAKYAISGKALGKAVDAIISTIGSSDLSGTYAIYSIPYVLLAYDAAGTDAAGLSNTRDTLVNSMVSYLNNISSNYSGVDEVAPILTALSKYCSTASYSASMGISEENYNAVRSAVPAAVKWLSEQQNADGTWSYYGTPNCESTALAIVALSALGIDAHTDSRFIKNYQSAVEGLMSFALADNSGFGHKGNVTLNALATEQGFRALVAYARYKASGTAFNIYTDSVSGTAKAPDISVISAPAIVTPAGSITVSFTLVGDAVHGEKAHTAYVTWIPSTSVTVNAGTTAGAVFTSVLDKNNYKYVGASAGYVSSITTPSGVTLSEKSNGKNSGWMYSVNGKDAAVGLNDYTLSNGDNIVWFYEDDYTTRGKTDSGESGKTSDALPFTDLKSQADKEAVAAVYSKKLMCGVSATAFAPEAPLSRAMAVTILWSLAGKPSAADKTAAFTDVNGGWYAQAVNWAVATGVAAGCGNGLFRPGDAVTLEQLAAMLYKFAGSPEAKTELSAYSDAAEVSGWALPAVKWAVGEGYAAGASKTLLDPKGIVDRAQCAAIIAAYCGKNA